MNLVTDSSERQNIENESQSGVAIIQISSSSYMFRTNGKQ